MGKKEVIVKGFASLPFSQVIRAGDFVFVSGQTVYDPDIKRVMCKGIDKQTEMILENIENMLAQSGGTLDDVVKTTVYLRRDSDFSRMNAVFKRYFQDLPPTRTTIVVSLVADVEIEIEAIAYIPRGKQDN
jgi:2-iminobutanoate/2-iminopropanoate deaminase